MAYTRLNSGIKITTFTNSSATIAAGGRMYLGLGSVTDVSGYVPVGVSVDPSGMSGMSAIVPSCLQSNGTALWVRVYNAASSSSTGSISATVYWAKA